ncbi:MAG: hypothetical protein ACI4VL_05075 [Bacilli bacterium]
MQEEVLIKKYFYSLNYIVLCQMYLNEYLKPEELEIKDLKKYNPGHLGTSLSLNFIQANLNYFLSKNGLTSKTVIGTGHGGISLISNLWLNGILKEYYPKYSTDKNGLNNLIRDFGTTIRSEINPEYPETIYDGGELGYSLGVAYGYAMNSDEDIISCIIGDGEAETGTLCSAWQLNKIIKTQSKVLPIINLNELKMGSSSFLSKFSNDELVNYYSIMGYEVSIVDSTTENNLLKVIDLLQEELYKTLNYKNPLIIFRSKKGFTLPNINGLILEGNTKVHKNPLQNYNPQDKLNIIKTFLKYYEDELFDKYDKLNIDNVKFKTKSLGYVESKPKKVDVKNDGTLDNIGILEDYLFDYAKENNLTIFSPDELFSNKFGKLSSNAVEILNENLLQALYQGYIQAGNNGLFISYEGFMPIITSMVAQYYKYLKQKQEIVNKENTYSMNYLLTSTSFENTYSHQNPEFVNALLQRDDSFYNVLYPKDGANLIRCVELAINSKNKINIVVTSKRHLTKYQDYDNTNIEIENLIDCDKPDLVLCATGDYMLDQIIRIYKILREDNLNIKIVYVTNPKILDVESKKALSETDFCKYFNDSVPIIYLFSGYSHIIKSLLYDRNIDCDVFGYDDQISIRGYLESNLESNGLSVENIVEISRKKLNRGNARILRK